MHRLTDCPGMTIAVYLGPKTTTQQHKPCHILAVKVIFRRFTKLPIKNILGFYTVSFYIDREQMLKVLLCITSGVLSSQPPDNRSSSLGGRLAQPIFQVR